MSKFALFSHNMPSGYSGGRYHSWVMAEALATQGHEVVYFSNYYPECYTDFIDYPHHSKIKFLKSSMFFESKPDTSFDYVVLIPNGNKDYYFYLRAELFSLKSKAKLILLNFESGNWFEEVSPYKKPFNHWINWQKLCSSGAIVLSSNKESESYARKFYNRFNANIAYINSHPAVNSKVAKEVSKLEIVKKRQLVFFVRLADAHKGGGDLSEFFCEDFRGFSFVFFVGVNSIVQEEKIKFFEMAHKYGIEVSLYYCLSDKLKFQVIKESSAVVFPSYFEGFGYPPVEARALNVPTICYDLPVLREVSGDDLYYVSQGDKKALVSKTVEVIQKKYERKNAFQGIEDYGVELTELLKDLKFEMNPSGSRVAILSLRASLYKLFYPITLLKREVIGILERIFKKVSSLKSDLKKVS